MAQGKWETPNTGEVPNNNVTWIKQATPTDVARVGEDRLNWIAKAKYEEGRDVLRSLDKDKIKDFVNDRRNFPYASQEEYNKILTQYNSWWLTEVWALDSLLGLSGLDELLSFKENKHPKMMWNIFEQLKEPKTWKDLFNNNGVYPSTQEFNPTSSNIFSWRIKESNEKSLKLSQNERDAILELWEEFRNMKLSDFKRNEDWTYSYGDKRFSTNQFIVIEGIITLLNDIKEFIKNNNSVNIKD